MVNSEDLKRLQQRIGESRKRARKLEFKIEDLAAEVSRSQDEQEKFKSSRVKRNRKRI